MGDPAERSQIRDELPTLRFDTPGEWERWLESWHERSSGVWLALAKRGAGVTGLTYAEALDGAICFGWIDGQKAALDERFWLQRFTPRRPRSRWSRINREKAEQLIAQVKMRPSGVAEVERAKADGRWARAYAPQRSSTRP